jgi:Ulp1 family protease
MVLWEKTEISCLHKKRHKIEEGLDCAVFLCRFVNFFRSKAPQYLFSQISHGGTEITAARREE